jgi:hypothetical protein
VWVGCAALAVWAAVAPARLAAQGTADAPAAAAAHLQAGEWSEAVALLRTLVRDDPGNGLAWVRLGRGLIELGREAEGLEALDAAEGAGFQSPFVGVFRARALARLGRSDDALTALEAVPPSPALGGGAALDTISDFAGLADEARFTAVVAAMERAAWPCRDAEASREFDFWIGTWDVYVQGQKAGTNVVERMLGGCTLLENWTNVRGREGKSFNWVDRATFRTPRWRQMWVDDSGNTLDYYDGHYSDGAMRFTGHTFSPAGDSIPQKLVFHDVHPDTVRQVFEQSNDGGATWVVTFDGLYVRRR